MFCSVCAERLKREVGDHCVVCCSFFQKADEIADKIAKSLDFEFESFNVGIISEGSFKAMQEFLTTSYDVKAEIKKTLQKKLMDLIQKKISSSPDVLILFNPEDFSFKLEIKPIFIYGRYLKRVRNVSQTRWLCGSCKGKGCEVCGFTGKRFASSVEELISTPVVEIFRAKDAVLHGAGREDVDARMLGSGRPFVLEVIEPRKRRVEISEIEGAVNEYCKGKIAVKGLRYATAEEVERVKEERFKKVYRAKVVFDREVTKEELESALKELVGEIRQRTPKRVLHRRSDILRVRRLYSAEILEHFGKFAIIKFETDAGLYVKELVSGDEGRTEPNLSKKFSARVEKLDVLEIKES